MNATATLTPRRFRPGFWTAVFVVLFLAFCTVTVIRFSKGLGAVTHLSDRFPWGLWIGFDLLCGLHGRVGQDHAAGEQQNAQPRQQTPPNAAADLGQI